MAIHASLLEFFIEYEKQPNGGLGISSDQERKEARLSKPAPDGTDYRFFIRACQWLLVAAVYDRRLFLSY